VDSVSGAYGDELKHRWRAAFRQSFRQAVGRIDVVVQQLDGKIEQSANEVASRVTDENGLMDAKLDQVTGRVNVALEVGSSANWRVPGIGWGVSLVRSRLLFVGCRHAGHRPQTRDVGARYPGVRAASRQRQSTASQGIGGLDQRAGAATNCHVSPTSSLRADVGVFAAQIRPMHGGRELIILRVRAWAAGAVRETQLKSGEIGMVELRTELVGLRRQLATDMEGLKVQLRGDGLILAAGGGAESGGRRDEAR
jgi:hypothetical protein